MAIAWRSAGLIEALDAAGVRGVAFDVFFPENPDQAAGTAALAKAAAASRAPVVLAVYSEVQDDAHVVTPNAAVIRAAKVREGAVVSSHSPRSRDDDGSRARAGEDSPSSSPGR